ncbi:MAG: hypothetical protein LIO96_03045 [Lachnospiraceae bacterium]|nr:hypothetical protein [Lachnospiraceae bacterium]
MDVINRLVRCPNGHYYNAAIHDFCPVCSGLATAAFHRQEENHINPVSGWLVCVDGPAKGCDYRIHGGYNYIGREIGDICIPGDQKISREKHAVVAYDERDRLFFCGSGLRAESDPDQPENGYGYYEN